jgi:MFS family permease
VVEASPYLSGFFLAMAVTRALGFLFSNAKTEILWIYGSILFASVFFVLGISGYLWCFPLVGLLGPFFPLVIARASRVFPQEADRLILKILTSMQLMLAICNILVGWATDKWGVEWAYRFPLVCFAITGIGLFIYFQKEKFAVSTTLR